MTKLMTRKVLVCGPYVEVNEFDRPVAYGFTPHRVERAVRLAVQRRADNIERGRKRLVRRAMANMRSHKPLFITLTYNFVQLDRDAAKSDVARFVRQFRRWLPDMQYLYVLERQKSGSWHVHMLVFNCRFVPVAYLLDWWSFANAAPNSVDVVKTNDTKHTAFYMAKYLGKDRNGAGNERLFSCSLNLLSPKEFRQCLDLFAHLRNKALVYAGGYFSRFTGTFITVKIYYGT